ncbi:hypothetical protein BDQ17DRAFT_1309590 [Cyathus striatus]|nr:hypothetical protein BDQ17DRAFT_1309590 [Cyathus striatus]
MSRQPANYISISRTHTSIKETYIIDPTIDVPAFLIPPLKEDETEETRMNLSLEATHGSINATVRLVEGEGGIERKRKRVTIAMKSEHGGITAQILDTPTRPPFHIQLQSSNGDIRLHIPRTFHGPITISIKHGSLRFSESLEESLISFGEMDGVCTGFIGDFSALSGKEAQSWDGDEIYVEAKHGHVRVLFDDDDNEGERDGTGKLSFFWKRLFRQ